MKKFRNILFLFTLLATAFSCQKHVIEYNNKPLSGEAEFQLHYFVPLTAGSASNILKVEFNGQLYANGTATLTTYNAIPSGSVGRFYTTKVGDNNIKLYMGESLTMVYDQNCNLKSGKQNIFVYDFNKPPIVFDNGYPYETVVSDSTAGISWIKFYNFLYESENVPTTLKIQYQYQYTLDYKLNIKSDWANLGPAVNFGETTGWQAVPVNITERISSGYGRIDYRMHMIDAGGADLGDLQVLNSSGKYVNYSDYWNAYVGRRYHHVMSGMRAAKPTSAVRVFTAL